LEQSNLKIEGGRTFLRRPPMAIKNFPQEVKKFAIETYERPKNLKELRKTHVSFSGSPLKHPNDPNKIICFLLFFCTLLEVLPDFSL
jgi:hypothetical protein